MANETVLIVDDDQDMCALLELYLKDSGYKVVTAEDSLCAVSIVEKEVPDLIILDVLMPKLDGFELCQLIRKKTDVPIIFLSSNDDDMSKILGLGIGGDDYITKSTSSAVLVARIKAHLRRSRELPINRSAQALSKDDVISFPGLTINLDSTVVKVDDHTVNLSAKEYQILTLMAQNPGRVYSIEKLFELVWDEKSLGDYRTVMVHISNLRKKLESNPNEPKYIQTVRGIGYKFNSFKD